MKRGCAIALGFALLASLALGSCLGPGLEPPTAQGTSDRGGAAGGKGVLDMGTKPGAVGGTGAQIPPPTTGIPASAGAAGSGAMRGDAGHEQADSDAGTEDAGL